jgi:hypothetical protein
VRFVVYKSLSNMTAVGSALKRPDGHFAALRKPKAAFTDEQHDFDGSVTRKHVALMDLLRIWRARVAEIDSEWIPTHHAGDMPTLRVADYAVIKRFVEAHPQQQ